LSASESAVYGLPNNLESMHSSSILPTGSSGSHENMPPFLGLNCIIALVGTVPNQNNPAGEPFISQIKWLAHDVVPTNFERCDGQLLSIASNTAFFALVGTTYGGDGRTTFGVPDMRDRMPVHTGTGPGLSPRTQGSVGGTDTVTLSTNQIPSHTHTLQAFDGTGDDTDPTNRAMHHGHHPFLHRIYNTQNPDVSMSSSAVTLTGGDQSHNNLPPYLTINCIIAKTGVFPSRN
jgi:microcystin-dependent protein